MRTGGLPSPAESGTTDTEHRIQRSSVHFRLSCPRSRGTDEYESESRVLSADRTPATPESSSLTSPCLTPSSGLLGALTWANRPERRSRPKIDRSRSPLETWTVTLPLGSREARASPGGYGYGKGSGAPRRRRTVAGAFDRSWSRAQFNVVRSGPSGCLHGIRRAGINEGKRPDKVR